MAGMSVVSWNVNAVRPRLPVLGRWLARNQPDLVCLQELRCPGASFPVGEVESWGYMPFVFGQPRLNGVAILQRKDSPHRVTSHFTESLNPE